MKIAVLSDIHGNLPALQVVAAHVEKWAPAVTIVNGDVVNRGPRPRECWEFVEEWRRTVGWRIISGNHERFVAGWENTDRPREGRRFEIHRSSFWTHQALGTWASTLPSLSEQEQLWGPAGDEIRVTHGTMRGDRDGIYPETANSELAAKIAPPPTVFCTAHTHHPFVRVLNGTLVVNSGAAGTTFDGDPRASYAQLSRGADGWQAQIIRLPYDRAQMARDFSATGFLEEGGPLIRIFFEEWYYARPMVSSWAQQYERAVIAGEIELEAAVSTFLAEHGGPPFMRANGRSPR